MKIIPEPVLYEWDSGNIDKNLKKHNVSNQEVEQAFKNEPKFIFEDEKHSGVEKRYALFSTTDNGKQLAIVFTIREDKVRFISARDMSKKDRRYYEQLKTNTKI